MKIIEIDEAQANQPKLTASYVDAFWRHGKQLLKGAAILGTGLLGYSAWRSWSTQEWSELSSSNAIATLPTNMANLDSIYSNKLADNLDITYDTQGTKKRTSTTQCNAYWQEFPSQAPIAGTALSNNDYLIAWTSYDGPIYEQSSVDNRPISLSGVDAASGVYLNVFTNPSIPPVLTNLNIYEIISYTWLEPLAQAPGFNINFFMRLLAGPATLNGMQLGGADLPAITVSSNTSSQMNMSMVFSAYDSSTSSNLYVTIAPNIEEGSVSFQPLQKIVSGQSFGKYFPTITTLSNGKSVVAYLTTLGSAPGIYCAMSPSFTPTLVAELNSYPLITSLSNGNFVILIPNVYWASRSGLIIGNGNGQNVTFLNYASPELADQGRLFGIIGVPNTDNFIVSYQYHTYSGPDVIYIHRFSAIPFQYIGNLIALSAVPAPNFAINYNSYNLYISMSYLSDGDLLLLWQNWALRVYQKLNIANACDQSYTQNTPQNLGLTFSALSYSFNHANVTVQLLNMAAGQLKSLQNTSETASARYNVTTGVWFEAGANIMDLNALLTTLQFIPNKDYIGSAMIGINAQDDLGNKFQSDFALQGISVNYPPSWINNQMVINQGQTLKLSRSNIQIYDLGKPDNIIEINVISAQNGQFEWVAQPGNITTIFTQQDINNGLVAFAHNGLSFSPTYALTATDSAFTTLASTGIVNFDFRPEVLINTLTINKSGQTVLLAPSQILAVDNDNLPNQLIFTVSNLENGHFELTNTPGKAVTTFSQLFIENGLVNFVHDGSDNAPRYTLTVNDGRMKSQSSNAAVTFNIPSSIPYTETTAFKAGVSVATTLVGTGIGFATWRYRNHKDAERRRQKSIMANIIRDELHLSGVNDFESEMGVQLIEAIDTIIRKLDKEHNVEVIGFTKLQQENFAHQLVGYLKPYVSHKAPVHILEGNNIISRTYLSCYYLKVKPIIKSSGCWLNTDAVKNAASTIAAKIKPELNNLAIEADNKNIEMQTLNC